MSKLRVLFIDDDRNIRLLAGAIFNNDTFEITLVADAQEAEKILRDNAYDVIICDVMMPGEDGIHFCHRLKQSGNTTPFLFLSAVDKTELVAKGLMIGAMAYLYKPFDILELQKEILALVAQHTATPQERSE